EDGIRDLIVTGVQTCALPISRAYELAFTVIGALALCVYLLWRLPALDAHEWVRVVASLVLVGGIVCLHPALFHRFADYALKRMRSEERRVGKECRARWWRGRE